jgi:hypothetical protein
LTNDELGGPLNCTVAARDINGAMNGTHPIADIVAGSYHHQPAGVYGAVYVINGETSGWTTPIQLSGP